MMKLSKQAEDALVNAGSNAIGTKVPVGTPQESQTGGELYAAELIGLGDGLTRKGSITRERIVSARLDAAF